MVQFGAIIFCRTIENYLGQFVWIEKKSHYNSRVSLHEAPTKKNSTSSRFYTTYVYFWKSFVSQNFGKLSTKIERIPQ